MNNVLTSETRTRSHSFRDDASPTQGWERKRRRRLRKTFQDTQIRRNIVFTHSVKTVRVGDQRKEKILILLYNDL